jgi:signal transduction histidine kinase/CheY-like chemotaxis protein
MFSFLKKKLANKILIAIVVTIAFIMGTEIIVRIYFGTKDRIELMNTFARELSASTYAGIKHPMAVGDAEGIRRQLSEIKHAAEDVEVFICDFDNEIIYSTHREKEKKSIREYIKNDDARRELDNIIETGLEPQKPFEDTISGKKYLVSLSPIMNNQECYHCHGSSRKVLGSMVVKVSAERIYATVAAQRNRTLILTLFGLSFVVGMIYIIVNRFIRRPVRNLEKKAKLFADGDMSVSVDIKTEDEIGVLGKSFNYMVGSVSSFSKRLEEEVRRKSSLLDERTRLLTLLEAANRDLRELDKLKSTFLANMSHELRTPMNSIIGYTDLLLDGVDGTVNEEQGKSLRKISTNARHLLQLINDVLDISKIESGKMKLSTEEIDFKDMVDTVIPTFEPLLKEKGLTLSVDINKDLPSMYGDEDKVKQILINLLSNAIKFTEKGTITISAHLSERGIQPGEPPVFAEICVEDSGIGIKEEDINKVFDKFVQVDLTTVRQYEGTGLGLSIARGLVALHKGMIWVTSKLNEGSKFCFTIPLNQDVLEKHDEPIVETRMAHGLADYFGKDEATFLKDPEYAGKPLRCWEYVKCGQPTCPAYGSKEGRCWLILGTHCTGMKIASYPEKVDFCKGCDLIKNLMLGAEESYASSSVSTEKKTVLAIDDNPEAIDIIKKCLGEEYEVIGLLSGEHAVEKAKEIKPAVITLDIMMPRKDGWQVLQELKDNPDTQDIPVVILSIVDDTKRGFSLGAAEYMVKPIDKQVLIHKLRNLERMKKISRILVVDKEAETVKSIAHALRESAYQVITADNSTDALAHIQEAKPDLLVLNPTETDVGFDVIEHLKTQEDLKDIPVIFITNKELTEAEITELNGRIQAILNKDILTEEDFLNELKETIAKVKQ